MNKGKNQIKIDKESIKIDFTLSRDEYIKSRRKFLTESKTISKGNIIFLIIMTLIEILFLIIGEYFFSIIIGVLLIISYILVSVLYFIQPGKLYDKTDFIKEKMEFEFDTDGIKSTIKNIKTKNRWNIFYEIWESKDFIYLMQSKMSYTIISKKAFKNNYDIVKIQQMYKEGNEKGKYINIK